MFTQRKTIIAASILALTFFLVSGERSEAITANAAATIAVPISVVETTALNHGTVTASGSLGTVTISTAGVRGVTGGVTAFGGTISQGIFTVTGEANNAFTITRDPTSSLTGPGAAMVATLSDDGPTNLSSGSQTINVGSSLAVAASQLDGAYAGTYSLTVSY